MIIYDDTLSNFKEDVSLNRISDILYDSLRSNHLSGGSESEINSWSNSLHFMKDVLDTPEIPKDCKVAVEYNIPQTSKRVDFMILGHEGEMRKKLALLLVLVLAVGMTACGKKQVADTEENVSEVIGQEDENGAGDKETEGEQVNGAPGNYFTGIDVSGEVEPGTDEDAGDVNALPSEAPAESDDISDDEINALVDGLDDIG